MVCPDSPPAPWAPAQSPNAGAIRYRELVREDWDAVFELSRVIWYADSQEIADEEVQLLASLIDISLLLKRTNYGIVAEEVGSGRIVGVVSVATSEPPPKRVQGWHEVAIARALERGEIIGAERGNDTGVQLHAFEGEMRRYLTLTEARLDKRYDGEVTLLLVDTAYQGVGMGRALLEQGVAWLRAQGCTRIFLITDDSCDYRFYDHLGWTRAQEFKADLTIFGKLHETVEYIYELALKRVASA